VVVSSMVSVLMAVTMLVMAVVMFTVTLVFFVVSKGVVTHFVQRFHKLC
jgi:hypothetical protein